MAPWTGDTAAGSGSGEHSAAASISGLRPDTVYRYRLLATNGSGTTTSPAGSFTTTHGFGFLPGAEGFAVTQGSHDTGHGRKTPYAIRFKVGLAVGGEFEGQPGVVFPDGDIRDLAIELPAGMIVNPNAVSECPLVKFGTPRVSPYEESRSGESCPVNSQVGTVDVGTSVDGGATRRFGLFSLPPPRGAVAAIGSSPYGAPITFDLSVRPADESTYFWTLRARNIPQQIDLHALEIALWGAPWRGGNDYERGDCLHETEPDRSWAETWWMSKQEIEEGKKPCDGSVTPEREREQTKPGGPPGVERVGAPTYLEPSICSPPARYRVSADAWQQPTRVSAEFVEEGSKGQGNVSPCVAGGFGYEPVGLLNDTKASSPSGFVFRLSDGEDDPRSADLPGSAPIKKIDLTLPEGVTINPSVGAGLSSCSPAQFAAEVASSIEGLGCPNSSKVGNFTAMSPLFDEFLRGGVYVGEPRPVSDTSGLELTAYLVARIAERAILVKAAGTIAADPGTGRIEAIFDGLPIFPYTKLDLTFRAGQRALLVTPPTCGTATTGIKLTSWAGAVIHTTYDSPITAGRYGGPCPSAADPTPPLAPKVVAGGVNANVNSYTPYFVHISRQDNEQELTFYSLVLPKGITGKLAGIPFCPDVGIEAARLRSGFAEAASSSCPASSQVGQTLSGYGLGSTLAYSSGRIFLAGPYHGAPLSLVTIDSATVGPFDLGTIVVRSAFQVDPRTAQLRLDSSASDPIPHILEGVPLNLREVRVYVDRRQFTHNPSSCEASQLESTVGGAGRRLDDRSDDSTATATSYFQLLNCLTLHFEPKLGIRLRGRTKRRAFPQLRANFVARGPQDSNLKEISVTIPHQEFLAQEHIEGICTKAQFEADRCPADSIYGSAAAYTPLLDEPLRGYVYLRTNPEHSIPDLVASLHSGAVRIILEGRIGPGRKGGIEAFFSDLPDQPLTNFVMTLYGGKRGLLQNSADICARPPVASVRALAQNNIGAVFRTKLRGKCGH
jgi:hypothetical protein